MNNFMPGQIKKGQRVTINVHGAGVTSVEKGHIVSKVTPTKIFLEGLENAEFDLKTGRTKPCEYTGFWFEIVPSVENPVTSKSEVKRLAIQKAKTTTVTTHEGKKVKLTDKQMKKRYGKSQLAEENSVRGY